MGNQLDSTEGIRISASGIGGIDSTTVSLEGEVTILEGRNATNRTSFLQAIMAALGSTDVTLKRDRDEGSVELTIGEQTYTRHLRRHNGTVQFSGDPFLSDASEADLFAFLLETNEVRQAVRRQEDLRDVIMRPIDTAEIDRQIRRLQEERREIDDEIERIEEQRTELPDLEAKRATLESELSETREELAEAREALDTADTDVEQRQEEQKRLESTLEDLNDARTELENVQFRIETEREALASSQQELAEIAEKRDEFAQNPTDQLQDIENELEQLRQQKRVCDTRVSKLHRIVQFNQEMLDGDGVLGDLFSEEDERAVTDQLLEESETACWTCGSQVKTSEIESMVSRLRELSQSQRTERQRLEDELNELTSEQNRLENLRDRSVKLSERQETLSADISNREETIDELTAQKEAAQERIANLEKKAEELEGVTESRVLELHKEVNEKEVAVERLEGECEALTERIEALEAKAERLTELAERREQISKQLTELRTRIDRLETDALDEFNEHMEALVELLEYDNLDRVWIERHSTSGTSTDRHSSFALNIVRTTEDGSTYEDTLDHLSESEREIVGLVFALAGYLVHEVYERVPVILLDSLEAIDSRRIALLIEYLSEYAPAIVAALLPEDTQNLDESYPIVPEI